ncbi:MAG: hypothetical protein JNJ39_00070 [Blastocatellia bacterium]|nr:hypothetical protein [Blastocatellia bacterium]
MAHIFLSLVFIASLFASVGYGQNRASTPPQLRFESEPVNTKYDENRDRIAIEAQLRLTLVNHTGQNVLLLRDYLTFWGKDVYTKGADGKLTTIYSQPGGNSYRHREKQRIQLLALRPPSNSIVVLEPKGSIVLDESVHILLYKRERKEQGVQDITLDEVRGFSSLWLSVRYAFWDPNLDLDINTMQQLDFGSQLRKNWEVHGMLWTEPIPSLPVEIHLRKSS